MFTKRSCLVLCLSTLMLSGCYTNKINTVDKKDVKPIEKTQYGIWRMNKCTIISKRADISIKVTDIYEKEKKMRLLLSSDYILAEKPTFKIYGLDDLNIELHGAERDFSFELPVAMIDKSRMYLDQAFIQVTYKIKGKDYFRRAIFSLKEVPEALLAMKKYC
ncbi:MAG: hypothetical protein GY793_05845 [Proteobacteria bacterium]|nr:hypothetical protein [Pseudomonadota bacterium]